MKKIFRINKRIDENLYIRFENFLKGFTDLSRDDFVIIIFDCAGGEIGPSAKIINLMSESQIKFIGIAYNKVHSAAIPIFLSTHVRFGYKNASSLIHRVKILDSGPSNEMINFERQVFELISQKLSISVTDVYEMANRDTCITMSHPLGKRFFIGN
jgi:ATP-dependent protease ClpP protease subunit